MRKDSDREQTSADSSVSQAPDSGTHTLETWRKLCLWLSLFLLISFGLKLYKVYYLKAGDDRWWDNPLVTGPGSQIIHFATEKLLPNLYPPYQTGPYQQFAAIVILWLAISGLIWLFGYLTITRLIARKTFRVDQ